MESLPNENQKTIELHQQQQEMIRLEMECESLLIGDLFNLSLLLDKFSKNPGLYVKVQNLYNKYDKYRKTRRDGSCFYRALAFCVFEAIYIKKRQTFARKNAQGT